MKKIIIKTTIVICVLFLILSCEKEQVSNRNVEISTKNELRAKG